MFQPETRAIKHGIYELPHEVAKDLGLTILRNYEIAGKFPNFTE